MPNETGSLKKRRSLKPNLKKGKRKVLYKWKMIFYLRGKRWKRSINRKQYSLAKGNPDSSKR